MIDFLFFMGFSVEDAAALGASYELYIAIPKHVDNYYLRLQEQKN